MRTRIVKGLCLLAAVLGWGTPSLARRTAIDGNGSSPLDGYCDLNGTGCTPVSLGYTVDFGSGPVSTILIYGNGLLSFGSQVADFAAYNGSLADYGVPIVSLGLNNAVTQSLTGDANEADQNVFYQDAKLTLGLDHSIDALYEVCPSSNPGDCRPRYDLKLTQDPQGYLATGTYYSTPATIISGYAIPGQVPHESTQVRPGVITFQIPASFGADLPTSAVPEPASWAMMIGGIGIAGGAMRRNRRMTVSKVTFA